jgi:hypothetical protein
MELASISDYFEAECYDVFNCDIHEYIANGFIVHNSGGLCSFCLAEGTPVTVRGAEVAIETLEEYTYPGALDEREFDTPWGLQVPDGVQYTGEKDTVEITTVSGRKLICTREHEILTHREGKVLKVPAGELVPDKDVVILTSNVTKHKPGRDSGQKDFLYPEMTGSRAQQKEVKTQLESVASEAKRQGKNSEQAVMEHEKERGKVESEQKDWLMKLRRANAYDEKITSITPAGVRKVYDVWNIERGHVFYANGFIVGNCSTGETEVVMADGSTKVITDVQVGEQVRMTSGKPAPVVARQERDVDEEIVLWQTERLRRPVRTTKNHKFPALRKDAYNPEATWDQVDDIPIGELSEGDYLIGPESTPEAPTFVRITQYQLQPYKGKVYNLEVGDDEHTYRIGYTEPPAEVQELLASLENPALAGEVLNLLVD